VAIDYKEQWKRLHNTHGSKNVRVAGVLMSLSELMNRQINETIVIREKLMEEFIKQRITTNIDGGTKNSHMVDIIFRGRQLDRVSVNKEDFQKWVDAKRGSCEPCVIRNIT
jgi:hypothetical protein